MKNKFVLSAALSLFWAALTLCSCSPVDKDYAVSSESSVSSALSVKSAPEGIVHPAIMSDDKIMPQFVDISVFDEENYYEVENERMCLDKDVIIKGNKIYSPETCCLVSPQINSLFTKRQNYRGNLPIGVILYNGKYCAQCNDGNGKSIHLGYFWQ